MFWAQALSAFALWIAYGAVQSRRSQLIRVRVSGFSRTARALGGAALMLAGAAILFAGFFMVEQTGGMGNNGLTAFGWLTVAAIGLLFVHAQTYAAAMMVSLVHPGVTDAVRPASTSGESEGSKQ